MFYIKICYKNKYRENNCSIETKSTKIKINSNTIDLYHEILFFKEINYEYGYLYFTIILYNNINSKEFKQTKIKISKLNLNKRQKVTMDYPNKSKFIFNYIISDNKDELDQFMKKAKEKRNSLLKTENIFSFLQNDSEINDDNINEENSSEKEENEKSPEKNKTESNIDKKEEEDLNEIKKINTNNSIQICNLKDDSKIDYSKIKLHTPENKIYLKPQIINNNTKENVLEKIYDTFCQGFFITSFPKSKGKIIENSKNYHSICGHITCGKLPAMEPEIIFKYPLKDSKDLELNNLCSSICFPSGIKVCYNQERRSNYKPFSSHIINQKGKKYYLSIYHFYHKIDNVTYNKLYSEHPLKIYLRNFGDNIYKTEEEKTNLEKVLEECQGLGFKEYVYIPYAIALVSKFPYINQMKIALDNIFIILTNHNNIFQKENKELYNLFQSIINDLIIYLIKVIPIPKINTSITFNLPFSKNQITILSPNKNNMINLIDTNFSILLKYFNINDILTIYTLILFEQKLLFIDNNYNRLYSVIESFLSLLYPIEWINTNIPIMSHQMTRYLQTFLPFINGISEDLFIKNAINALNENEDEVYEIYIVKGCIKCRKKEIENDDIPKIPDLINNKLLSELNDLKEIYSNLNDNDKIQYFKSINNIFSNIFMESNAIIFYDFMDFIFNINENNNNLDGEMLRKMIYKKYEKENFYFYNDLIDTQIFLYFINNIIYNKNEYTLFISMLRNIQEKYIISHSYNKPTKWKNIIRKIELKDIINYKKSTLFNIPIHLLNSSIDNSIKNNYIINYEKWSKINNDYLENKNEENLNISKLIIEEINSEYISNSDRIANNLLKINNNLFFDEKKYEKYILPINDDNQEEITKENSYIEGRASTLLNLKNIFQTKRKTRFISSNNVNSFYSLKNKYSTKLKNELELTDEEKENIKNNFKLTLKNLFEDNPNINVDECIQNVYYNIGRKILCEIIFQKGFKIIQIINDKCFLLLKKIFLNALISICNINENQEILDFAVKITQSGFFYCKESNNNILLIDELRNRLGNDYFMWIKKNFWNTWQNIENYFSINSFSAYCDIIKCELLFKLLRIKIDKEFINNYLKECLEEKMMLMQESYKNNKKKNKEYNELYVKTKIEIIKIVQQEEY